MKKVLLLFLLLLLPIKVLGEKYSDESMNLSVDIDNYIVLTRNNLENNNDLIKLGISKENLEEIMNKNAIYFDIIKEDLSQEILIVIPDTKITINNLSNVSNDILNDLGNELAEMVGINKTDIYKNKYTFLVREYFDKNTDYYIINYYTVVNAKGYNIQLQKHSPITEDDRRCLKDIVDSTDIQILDEYRYENSETQKEINNYGKKSIDWKEIIIKALIGAVIGALASIMLTFVRKKIKH